jgi:hypothetical protein
MSAETIRLIPVLNDSHEAWIAAPSTDDAIKSERLAHGLQEVLGMERPLEVEHMDIVEVTEDRVINPIETIDSPDKPEGVTELKGYAGIKIETGKRKTIDTKVAKQIGVLLAREYDDEEDRVLVNYAARSSLTARMPGMAGISERRQKKLSRIQLTGEGYNLAATQEKESTTRGFEEWKIALDSLFDRLHVPRHAH